MRELGSPLRLGRVIMTRLPPGKSIHPHRDEGPVPEFYKRFHLVVQGGDENVFMIEDEVKPMQSGEMWETDVRQMHTVINLMDQDRIHLIVDIER
jgi:aspartyl/asparaginyl beta-hydroxylase (cupin superfamily)